MAATQRELELTKQKALSGQILSNPTQEKIDYYNKFSKTPYGQTAKPVATTPQPNLNTTAPVNFNQYKSQSATIGDISSKYGFDFSRDYAKRQAEAEAQAKRNAVADAQRKNQSNKDVNLKSIDNNLMSAAEGLDRNYFQQYQQQQQAQVNGGINGGIAADQDLRMAMARQAAMGDAYRDANLGRMQENNRFTNDDLRLAEELGLINQSALAREDSLYNDRLMQGAGLAQETDRFNLSQNGMLLDAAMRNRDQNIGMDQFNRTFAQNLKEFDKDQFWKRVANNNNNRDYARSVLESDRGYNRGVLESDRNYGLSKDQFDWSKYVDGQQLSISRQNAANSALRAQQSAAEEMTKPKTGPQTIVDATKFWSNPEYKNLLDKYGTYQVEEAIRGNSKIPELADFPGLDEIASEGYNPNTFIDALWNVSTNGKFKTRSAYDKYVATLNKQTEKEKEKPSSKSKGFFKWW